MTKRRAMPSTDDLRAMAKMVAEYGVTFRAETGGDGKTRWSMSPTGMKDAANGGPDDDLDERLAKFAQ